MSKRKPTSSGWLTPKRQRDATPADIAAAQFQPPVAVERLFGVGIPVYDKRLKEYRAHVERQQAKTYDEGYRTAPLGATSEERHRIATARAMAIYHFLNSKANYDFWAFDVNSTAQ